MFKFPTQQISIVCAFVLFITLTFNLAVGLARDADRKTYRCVAKDAVSILMDGTLNRLIGEVALKDYEKIIIDVSDGSISFPSTSSRQDWIVEKIGLSTDNDYLLYPKSARRTAANAVADFIRLRATEGEQPRFMAFKLSYLVTGTCEIAK